MKKHWKIGLMAVVCTAMGMAIGVGTVYAAGYGWSPGGQVDFWGVTDNDLSIDAESGGTGWADRPTFYMNTQKVILTG